LTTCVAERGVDTWRFLRRMDRELDELIAADACPGGLFPGSVEGHRVGYMPGHSLLWVEGHPVADRLADPDELPAAHRRVLDALEAAGLPRGRDGGLSRVDATVTVRCGGPSGLATLQGVAALDVPRMKPAVYGKPPQTVYWQGERTRKVFARVYDKGLEAGTALAGELLRYEDQRRFAKDARRPVEHLEPAADFARRFAPLARSATGLRVMTLPVMQRELSEAVNCGDYSHLEAERLLGYLMLDSAWGRYPRSTWKRRRRELRDHGLVLADDFYEPVTVDLGAALDLAVGAW